MANFVLDSKNYRTQGEAPEPKLDVFAAGADYPGSMRASDVGTLNSAPPQQSYPGSSAPNQPIATAAQAQSSGLRRAPRR
jgi:hypothetical protein